jgi:hypothetical protein
MFLAFLIVSYTVSYSFVWAFIYKNEMATVSKLCVHRSSTTSVNSLNSLGASEKLGQRKKDS